METWSQHQCWGRGLQMGGRKWKKKHEKLRAANNVHLTKLNGFLNPSPTSRIDRNLTTKFLNTRELKKAQTGKVRMSRYVHQLNPTKVHRVSSKNKGTQYLGGRRRHKLPIICKICTCTPINCSKMNSFIQKMVRNFCQKNFNAWGDKIDLNYWGFRLSEGTKDCDTKFRYQLLREKNE